MRPPWTVDSVRVSGIEEHIRDAYENSELKSQNSSGREMIEECNPRIPDRRRRGI